MGWGVNRTVWENSTISAGMVVFHWELEARNGRQRWSFLVPPPVYLYFRHQDSHCQPKFPAALPILAVWGLLFFIRSCHLPNCHYDIAFPILTHRLVVFSLKTGFKKIKWHQEIKHWPSAMDDEAIYKKETPKIRPAVAHSCEEPRHAGRPHPDSMSHSCAPSTYHSLKQRWTFCWFLELTWTDSLLGHCLQVAIIPSHGSTVSLFRSLCNSLIQNYSCCLNKVVGWLPKSLFSAPL